MDALEMANGLRRPDAGLIAHGDRGSQYVEANPVQRLVRTFAWLPAPSSSSYDRKHEIHEAFLAIGCCLVCYRRLQNSF